MVAITHSCETIETVKKSFVLYILFLYIPAVHNPSLFQYDDGVFNELLSFVEIEMKKTALKLIISLYIHIANEYIVKRYVLFLKFVCLGVAGFVCNICVNYHKYMIKIRHSK